MDQKILNSKRVHELLTPQNILIDLQAIPKREMIAHLVKHLPQEQVDKSTHKDIIDAILKREAIESTAIGNGIAIPHARLDALDQFHIILGLSKEGFNFDSIDKKPVHILFLVLSHEQQKVLYIRILARLARLLHNGDFRKGLLEQQTPAGVMDFIKKYESF
jgi:mannitol/fructose-specific phosphotransferase system IIA component (Ntr-type)